MLGELERFLDSGLLSAREETIYKKRYCDFVREAHGGNLADLNGEILKTYLRFLVDLKEYGQALQLWKTHRPALRSDCLLYTSTTRCFSKKAERTGAGGAGKWTCSSVQCALRIRKDHDNTGDSGRQPHD